MLDYACIRQRLHQLAEPSGVEYHTHSYLLKLLQTFEPTEIHTFDNSRNILALYDFGSEGPTILFRGDFDAVRVIETLDVPYHSLTEGVAHKCGHDGHATILLGLAEQLHQQPLTRGRVLLFFQAAEETGEGAQQLLDTKILEQYCPDKVFALHNIPGAPMGAVLCKIGSFTCSVVSCDIELYGQTSHAAEPLKAVCPYDVAKSIADKLLSYNQYDICRDDFCLLTLVEFRVGEQAYGVTAGNGVLRFTLRAQQDALLRQTQAKLCSVVKKAVSATEGIGYHIEWKEYFAASHNQQGAVEAIRRAAETCELPYVEKEIPFSWGEDFGLLTQHYNGALFGLGAGEQQPSLHHPDFDFPDALLAKGVQLFYAIAVSELMR